MTADTAHVPAELDARHFRDVLGRFPTGVVAVTGFESGAGAPVGLAVNSFTSVSLRPPLVSFCVAHTSSSWPRLRTAHRLAVNILGEDQRQVSRDLAAKSVQGDKFVNLRWSRSAGGTPIIADTPAWLECTVTAEHPAGDHLIVVAAVHHFQHAHDGGPLVFFRGGYGRFAPTG
ncbi:MAG TPA: flavin reductase family protein [Pseudonocardiaceae bacterium]|jgi:flavin reductase (DIM6/NTAB) family NADH-FMN oxidoreductase RutF|nr:flavin reductase family protein [Pseudonocardiaceae bacterium]